MVKCTCFITIIMLIQLTSYTEAFYIKQMVRFVFFRFIPCPFIQGPYIPLREPSDESSSVEKSHPQHFILFKKPSYKQMIYNKEPPRQTKDSLGLSSENLIKVSKRNPACIRRCLGRKVLHPAQCHYLC